MQIKRQICCLIGGILGFACINTAVAYTVDCTGAVDPSVQDAVNTIGNTETIFIDGVCSGQGLINITTSGVTLQGLGGGANTANNVIEGRITLRGALNTNIRFLTLSSDAQTAMTMIDTSVLRLLGASINADTTAGPATALQMISGRATLINSEISANALAGNATAINASSNSVVVFAGGTTVDSTASGQATGLAGASGSVIWLDTLGNITASGATSIAAFIYTNGDLRSLGVPSPPGEATTLDGDILVIGGGANLSDINQTSGVTTIIDGSLVLDRSDQFDTTGPLSLRNSSLRVSGSTVQLDIDAFLNSVVTLEQGSTVTGTLELMFGSKLAVLSSSTLGTLIKDGGALEETLFVDATSAVESISTSKKDKKYKPE